MPPLVNKTISQAILAQSRGGGHCAEQLMRSGTVFEQLRVFTGFLILILIPLQ
jgi:hypothetical protein